MFLLVEVRTGLIDISFREITDLLFTVTDQTQTSVNKITRNDEASLRFEFKVKSESTPIDTYFYSNKSCTLDVRHTDVLNFSVV